MVLEGMNECLMNPINYTEITYPEFESIPKFQLDDLFLRFDEIPEEQRKTNLFRVKFYAVR